MNLFLQAVSLLGAGLVLAAFIGLQRAWWSSTDRRYLWYNLLGSAMLTAVAIWDRRLGFVLLEAVWAAVSAMALARPTKTS
jgi:hypothetical protein